MDLNDLHNAPAEPAAARIPSPTWRTWLIAGGLTVVTIVGVGAAGAMASDFARGDGAFMMKARMGGHFAHRRLGHLLDEIDATEEQEKKLWEIFGAAQAEIGPMAREFRTMRGEAAELLGAATIDREAVEKLRADRVAAIDEASRKVAASIVEAAEVLTPEQRAKLVEHFEERRAKRRW